MSHSKMSYTEIYCDGKAAESKSSIGGVPQFKCLEGFGYPSGNLRDARRAARLEGWVVRGGLDLCPMHAAGKGSDE